MLTPETARFRATVIRTLRAFFDEREYLEVDTPMLAPHLIPEPHIEPFATTYLHPHLQSRELYLVPSPELWMKRLLGGGYGDIYQLARCFRNGESIGAHHQPEFTMLEWYTVGADYEDSADLTDSLLGTLYDRSVAAAPGSLGGPAAESATHPGPKTPGGLTRLSAVEPPALRITVAEAFEQFAGVSRDRFSEAGGMVAAASELGMRVGSSGGWGPSQEDAFHQILANFVEPQLPRDRPVMLFDYPAFVPTLARRGVDGWSSERWELYLGGIEVANCFSEEREPERLADYLSRAAAAADEPLVGRTDDPGVVGFSAMPACSGVALGVDRLIMALAGTKSIEGVIHFPLF